MSVESSLNAVKLLSRGAFFTVYTVDALPRRSFVFYERGKLVAVNAAQSPAQPASSPAASAAAAATGALRQRQPSGRLALSELTDVYATLEDEFVATGSLRGLRASQRLACVFLLQTEHESWCLESESESAKEDWLTAIQLTFQTLVDGVVRDEEDEIVRIDSYGNTIRLAGSAAAAVSAAAEAAAAPAHDHSDRKKGVTSADASAAKAATWRGKMLLPMAAAIADDEDSDVKGKLDSSASSSSSSPSSSSTRADVLAREGVDVTVYRVVEQRCRMIERNGLLHWLPYPHATDAAHVLSLPPDSLAISDIGRIETGPSSLAFQPASSLRSPVGAAATRARPGAPAADSSSTLGIICSDNQQHAYVRVHDPSLVSHVVQALRETAGERLSVHPAPRTGEEEEGQEEQEKGEEKEEEEEEEEKEEEKEEKSRLESKQAQVDADMPAKVAPRSKPEQQQQQPIPTTPTTPVSTKTASKEASSNVVYLVFLFAQPGALPGPPLARSASDVSTRVQSAIAAQSAGRYELVSLDMSRVLQRTALTKVGSTARQVREALQRGAEVSSKARALCLKREIVSQVRAGRHRFLVTGFPATLADWTAWQTLMGPTAASPTVVCLTPSAASPSPATGVAQSVAEQAQAALLTVLSRAGSVDRVPLRLEQHGQSTAASWAKNISDVKDTLARIFGRLCRLANFARSRALARSPTAAAAAAAAAKAAAAAAAAVTERTGHDTPTRPPASSRSPFTSPLASSPAASARADGWGREEAWLEPESPAPREGTEPQQKQQQQQQQLEKIRLVVFLGAPRSGKRTLTRALASMFRDECSCFDLEAAYKHESKLKTPAGKTIDAHRGVNLPIPTSIAADLVLANALELAVDAAARKAAMAGRRSSDGGVASTGDDGKRSGNKSAGHTVVACGMPLSVSLLNAICNRCRDDALMHSPTSGSSSGSGGGGGSAGGSPLFSELLFVVLGGNTEQAEHADAPDSQALTDALAALALQAKSKSAQLSSVPVRVRRIGGEAQHSAGELLSLATDILEFDF